MEGIPNTEPLYESDMFEEDISLKFGFSGQQTLPARLRGLINTPLPCADPECTLSSQAKLFCLLFTEPGSLARPSCMLRIGLL